MEEHNLPSKSAILDHKNEETAKAIEDLDDWNDDPANPRNWPSRKKWLMVFIVGLPHFIKTDR